MVTVQIPVTETAIQAALCEHLRMRAKPGVLWLHPANGERRDKLTGAKLKRMGVLPGASDLLLWHAGNSYALELKARGCRPTEAQLEFMARFNDAGGHSAYAEGLDAALRCLEGWGLLLGKSQVAAGRRQCACGKPLAAPGRDLCFACFCHQQDGGAP